jgi:NitT/TauT family transport system permease protein
MAVKRNWLKKALIALIYLAVWEAASLLVGRELLLPAPLSTLTRLISLLGRWESWAITGLTLLRIMSGYVLGVVLGILLAVATARSRLMEDLLSPLRSVVKATPVTSFILLALLWLDSNLVPLFIALLMVMPMVWTDTADAIVHTDPRLIEMGKMFGLGRAKIIRKIAAEIIALPQRSIGYRLYESKLRIETVDLFAWTLMVILLSMLLEKLLVKGMRRIRRD